MSVVRLSAFGRPPALVAAERLGHFAERDLDVHADVVAGSAEQMRGLADGRWDIVHTAADNVLAWGARGADVFVFCVADIGIAQQLVVRPEIRSIADLRGAAVGVDAPTSGYAFVLFDLLAAHGLSRGDYDVVPIGSSSRRVAALRKHVISGCLLGAGQQEQAIADGMVVAATAADAFAAYPGLTAATTRGWASAHDDALHGYAEALAVAARWVLEPRNRQDVIAMLARDRGEDLDRAARTYRRATANRRPPTQRDVQAALRTVADLRARWTGAAIDVGAFVDLAVV